MLLDKIRDDIVAARKDKNTTRLTFLSTLFSEAEKFGKDKGNRASTDDEVIAVVKKFIKGIEETQKALMDRNPGLSAAELASNDPKFASLVQEINALNAYLPKQMNEAELRDAVAALAATLDNKSPQQMGVIMKLLKEKHGGTYDGALASKVVKEVLQS